MSWAEYADYHFEPNMDHQRREYSIDEKTCVARLMDMDLEGENRFYVAPAEDGSWFAWGDWHATVKTPEPNSRAVLTREPADDATHTFADGGAFFPTREEAMAAIYRWIARDTTRDLQRVRKQTTA